NVPTETLKGFQEATEGTIDKVSLLKFGMKALHGEFHLTADGAKLVLEAAQHLHDQGFGPTLDIAEKLEESLRTGNVKTLKEYGVALANTKDKMASVKEELEAFHRIAASPVNVDPGLQAIERLEAKVADFKTAWKVALGEIGQQLAGMIN